MIGICIHISAAAGFAAQGAGGFAPRAMVQPWRQSWLNRNSSRPGREPREDRLRNLIRQRAITRSSQRKALHQPQILCHQRPEGLLTSPSAPRAEQFGIGAVWRRFHLNDYTAPQRAPGTGNFAGLGSARRYYLRNFAILTKTHPVMKNIKPLHLILGGCGLAILGCVLPWATRSVEASIGMVYNRQSGLESASGVVTLLLAAASIVLYFVKVRGKEKLLALVALLCADLAALIGIISMFNIDSWTVPGVDDVKVSIGVGLYLVVLGGAAGAFGWFQRFQKIPGSIVPPPAPPAGTPPSSLPPAP